MEDYILQPEESIDGCVIKKGIGQGGFGQVYLAECDTGERVALKLYTTQLDYTDFFSEVMVMGLFNHKPFFVKFHGAKFSTHYSYILMEYMAKGDLRARIRRERPNQADAVQITFMIALALREMHTLRVFHRDVSPENIFFDKNDEPKLGDMGCALTLQERQDFAFKIPYTAPELLEGRSYSAQSDIYSLGAVFYEMLGGNIRQMKPCNGLESLKTPAHLKKIMAKMCHKDPELRYTANELLQELTRLVGWEAGRCSTYVDPGTYSDSETERGMPQRSGWENIRDVIFRSGFLEEQRMEEFRKGWIAREASTLKGLRDDFRYILYRGFLFSLRATPQKHSNCYLGIEHVLWTCLEEQGFFFKMLSRAGISVQEINKKLFQYLSRIQYFPLASIFSPRLDALLSEVKRLFPEGVGEKEFVLRLLETENFFLHLLKAKGADLQTVKEEVAR